MAWGDLADAKAATAVKVRFKNNGGKQYARAEMHLAYKLPAQDATKVTFAWTDSTGDRTAEHTFTGTAADKPWTVPTAKGAQTKWVEFASVVR